MGNWGLSESQKKILDVLIHVPEFQALNFYLARGAGLILYFSHRTSRDEDFFSQEQFQPEHFLAALSGHFQVQVLSREKGTLHLSLDGVLCSFFHYPYALIEKNLIDNMPVASIPDIAAMKLSALVSRGSKRDFVDLYFILNRGYAFEDLWTIYRQKYQTTDDELYNLLKSMVYFDDAEKETLDPAMETAWPAVKNFFRKLVQELLKKNHH